MLFKVKETQKVYEISLKGWDGSAWSVDLSNDLLTDMDYQDGMEMSQKEFDEYVAWLEDDVATAKASCFPQRTRKKSLTHAA